MTTQEKCIERIEERLHGVLQIKDIERVSGLPKEIFFIDWSIGTLERSYYFKITGKYGNIIYCDLSTLFGRFIFKTRFFKYKNGKYSFLRL